MLREGSLEEISDGKLYTPRDMVRADTGGCKGCSRCCEVMVDSIVLTPLDVHHLSEATGFTLTELIEARKLELTIRDGMLMPVLRGIPKKDVTGDPLRNVCGEELRPCPFLNDAGQCSVYTKRPDLCRLFPLGRIYTEDGFSYFLQDGECDHPRSKVKVKKWIADAAIDDERYAEFLLHWHEIAVAMRGQTPNETVIRRVFSLFYAPYESGDFYAEFAQRRDALLQA